MMKSALSLLVMLSVFAVMANAAGGYVGQTSPSRVVATIDKTECVFEGPIQDSVIVSCKEGTVKSYLGREEFLIGTCRYGAEWGVSWEICRVDDTNYTYFIQAGAATTATGTLN